MQAIIHLLGTEEAEIITPAIQQAQKEGILAFGPFPADGFFGAGSFAKFDGILAMYHDQGLTPFKALSFDSGVNFTAGLPFVRTSPVHGTALQLPEKEKLLKIHSVRQFILPAIFSETDRCILKYQKIL